MGRRRAWFLKVKKALGSEHSKEHGDDDDDDDDDDAKCVYSKKMLFSEPIGIEEPDMIVNRAVEYTVFDVPWSILEESYMPASPVLQQAKLLTKVESQEKEHDNVPVAKEETAATRIQMAFRRHKAKRRRGLRGVVRLNSLMQGCSVKRQTAATMQCMQTLSRVQSQIRARRTRMSEENQALQRQLQQKHEKEMEKMKEVTIGDDWNDSTKSKEKLEASLRYRQEAAIRRERALAYAHSHQQKWRNGLKAPNPTFMDPINPHWGWNWLERWMDARPWESSTQTSIGLLSVDEISKAYYARHPDNSTKPLPIPQRSSRLLTRRSPPVPSMSTKAKSALTRAGQEDSMSISSTVQTCKQRRHSVASSSMTHNARLSTSYSDSARSTMTSARARLQKSSSSRSDIRVEVGSLGYGYVKKRLSCSPCPSPSGARRAS
ncbi:hypothetical protein QQ045_002941 [Rhodiola kirilowii]